MPNAQLTHCDLKTSNFKCQTRKNAASIGLQTTPSVPLHGPPTFLRADRFLGKNNGKPTADDNTFDFVILTSVFTHMVAEEVAHYLIEIQRVMKENGTCVATFFVLNEKSRKAMVDNPHFNFPHDFGHYALVNAAVQSANVAFDEAFLAEIVAKSGLKIKQKVVGFWSHGERSTPKDSYQDV